MARTMNRKTFLRVLGASAAGAAHFVSAPFSAAPAAAATAIAGPTHARAKMRFGAWVGGFDSTEKWKRALARMSKAGMNTILPGAGDEETVKMIPLAREEGIDVHAWRVQMRSDEMIKTHPEWYAV